MKIRSILAVLSLAASLLATGGKVHAQAANNPTISVDETGLGTIRFPGSPIFPLPGVLAPDPGPGGLSSALTYNLLGPPSLVAGDVILLEPGLGVLTDIIRFNPAGTGGNPAYPASLVFYSDLAFDGGNSPADVGFPTALYTNTVSFVETGPEAGPNGFSNYTPTANQPGFVPGFGVTYNFTSDAGAVPEPASFVMAGTAVLAGLGYAWRRKRAAA
jgi:hypothetical protein